MIKNLVAFGIIICYIFPLTAYPQFIDAGFSSVGGVSTSSPEMGILQSLQDRQIRMEAKLLGSSTSNTASFGYDVDISGDTAVVGAWYDDIGTKKAQGSVFVYVRRSGFWVEQAKLVSAEGVAREHFGQRVAIDGDTIVVGVPAASKGKDLPGRFTGSAYVFTRTGDHWGEQVKLIPSDSNQAAAFGSSVDITGDTIIIGSMGNDNFPDDRIPQAHGAAFVFVRSSGSWAERQKLVSGDKRTTAFGTTVAINDKTAVVGAISSKNAVGSVFVFVHDGEKWAPDGQLTSGAMRLNDNFALLGLAIDRGTIVVGATETGAGKPGAAYVFNKGISGWEQTAKLTAWDNDIKNDFGISVDISGDMLVVGTRQLKGPIAPRAYVFRRQISQSKLVWTQHQILLSPETFLGDTFANSVGISGDSVIVGADTHDSRPKGRTRGAAYVFSSSAGSPDRAAGGNGVVANRGPENTRKVVLTRNARKNGYTTTKAGDAFSFQAGEVDDPLTKKLLEGAKELEYRCKTSEPPAKIGLQFSRGISNRITVTCLVLTEPQILILGEPTPNED